MKALLFSLSLIIISGCCKDCTDDTNPKCPNYNPCKGKNYTADFSMYQEFSYKNNSQVTNGRWYEDSLYRSEFFNGDIVPFYFYDNYIFEAKCKNAKSYQWKIGNDPRERTGSSFSIGFSGNEGLLPIRLIVELDETDPCNKAKKRYDTVYKSFKIESDYNNLPYVGNKYSLKSTSSSDQRIIEIFKGNYRCANEPIDHPSPVILNITDTFLFTTGGVDKNHFCAREIYFNDPSTCYFWSSQESHDNKTILGNMRFNGINIYLNYRKILHSFSGNRIIKTEISNLFQYEGNKL